ncbi:hypothetical protein [Paraburkholderia kururiensis]|nr:hypothetical protein [Paraburkholderia kururiensis]
MKKRALHRIFGRLPLIVFLSVLLVGAMASSLARRGEVEGFESANFGSTEEIVSAAIRKDFADAKVEAKMDDVTGMKKWFVYVNNLPPFNVPAQIVYGFGYRAKTLVQIDIVWDLVAANRQNPERIRRAIEGLIDSYSSFDWAEGNIITGYFLGNVDSGSPLRFLFFRGISRQKRMIALLGWPVYAKLGRKGEGVGADFAKLGRISAIYQVNATATDARR